MKWKLVLYRELYAIRIPLGGTSFTAMQALLGNKILAGQHLGGPHGGFHRHSLVQEPVGKEKIPAAAAEGTNNTIPFTPE